MTARRSNLTARSRRPAARVSRRTTRVRGVTRRHEVFRNFTIADATLVAGTTRLTDLGLAVQARWGEDILGCKLAVIGRCSLVATVGGVQSYTYATLVGPDTLDAADLAPAAADADQRWASYRHHQHRGQSHNVLSAVSEFNEMRLVLRSPPRLIRDRLTTLWLAEEVLTQSQNARWFFDAHVWLP